MAVGPALNTGAPEVVVDAPQLELAPTGLVQACGGVTDWSDDHMGAGITYAPESPFLPVILDPCRVQGDDLSTIGEADLATAKTTHRPIRYNHPITIEATDRCGDFGWQVADYIERAARVLAVKEQPALEAEFWTGATFPTESYLCDGAKTISACATTNGSAVVAGTNWGKNDVARTVTGTGIAASSVVLSVVVGVSATLSKNATATGTPTDVVATNPNYVLLNSGTPVGSAVGFAMLQEAIAESRVGLGMIHCTAALAERWGEQHALRFAPTAVASDPRMRLTSDNGNIVAAGNGYSGVGPDGTGGTWQSQKPIGATTVQWAFATDLIKLHRRADPTIIPGPISDIRQAMDRDTGLITFRQQRPWIVQWAGLCHAAIAIDVTT